MAMGLAKNLLKILLNYLSDRWQRIKINRSFSAWSEWRQRSVVEPNLFNISINDLFYFLTCVICNFTDDTTPYVW